MEQPQSGHQGRQPGQQTQVGYYRHRYRSGRCVGSRFAGRAGIQRQDILHPGLSAPRSLDRCAGRYQRSQELSERQRLGIPSFLRYDQGRRLPCTRGKRIPSGRGIEPYHRPVRSSGRSVRTRVRRSSGQPFVRRCSGIAYVLCPRPDRTAAAAGRIRRSEQGDSRRLGQVVPAS